MAASNIVHYSKYKVKVFVIEMTLFSFTISLQNKELHDDWSLFLGLT